MVIVYNKEDKRNLTMRASDPNLKMIEKAQIKETLGTVYSEQEERKDDVQ